MKKYVIFILILITACSTNINHSPTVFKKEYQAIKLPDWLLNIPPGKYEIGISQKMSDKKNELINAKEFAAVNFNRNKHSFIVNNFAKIKGEEFSNQKKFKINVSSSVKNLKSVSDSLCLVDSTYISGYLVALFHYGKNFAKSSYSDISQLTIPSWYNQNKIRISGNEIFATVKYSSAYLTSAVNKAMEKARFVIASYKNQHVQSINTSTYSSTKKAYTLESKILLGNLKTTNIFILKKKSDDALTSYEVYLRMRAKK